MPELPDVEIYKREAEKAAGKKIRDAEIRDRHFVQASPHDLDKSVTGNKLEEAIRIGKYLFLKTDDNKAVVMHFGMTGSLEFLSDDKKAPKYVKCIFYLQGGHQLCYTSRRKLGNVEVTEDLDHYIDQLELGPDALEIGKEDFSDAISESSAMAKSFLMDQSSVCGLGNIYSDEILFQAGIHPRKKCSDLSEDEADEMYKQMKRVLKKAIEKEAIPSDLPNSYLIPHREKGEVCPKCGGKVKKIKISGRSGYYCPSCQGE